MMTRWHRWVLSYGLLLTLLAMGTTASAQEPEESGATTELSCSFALEKGEPGGHCRVPFPQACLIAVMPGTTHPWTTISKGGHIQCRFDDKHTDWKTTITGICGTCRSVRCSAHFSVRFDCSAQQ